jgi:hypothetical protein
MGVEYLRQEARAVILTVASMRPLPEGSGRRLAPASTGRTTGSFNEATPRREWNTLRGVSTTLPRCCFNEATPRREWEYPFRHPLHWCAVNASKKPLPAESGTPPVNQALLPANNPLQWSHFPKGVKDRTQGTQDIAGTGCFNGATVRRPWKTSRSWRICGTGSRFNGATVQRPWNAAETLPFQLVPSHQLQWGHGPMTMENTYATYLGAGQYFTLQWGHGPKTVEYNPRATTPRFGTRGFNGATARRPWKTAIGTR